MNELISFSPFSVVDVIMGGLVFMYEFMHVCMNVCISLYTYVGVHDVCVYVPDSSIRLSNNSSSTTFISDAPVRNLGVTFDPHLSFSNHISNLSRSCFMHIRDLRRIR